MTWRVTITNKASRRARQLSEDALSALHLLWQELQENGPIQPSWPHFGKLKGRQNEFHCHLNRGRPTYVVCWRIQKYTLDERKLTNEDGEIEIFYAWTHEKAPY